MVFQQFGPIEDLALAWATAQNNEFIVVYTPESIDELPHPDVYRQVDKMLYT